ncbi:heme-binding protein, partial [Streptomyces tricolor]
MSSRKKPSRRTRVLVGGAALAVLGAGVVGTVAANAADTTEATPAPPPLAAPGGDRTQIHPQTREAAPK